MEADAFGDAAQPNVPAVFALCCGDRTVFTLGAEFLVVDRVSRRELFRGRVANDSPICFASVAGDELVLATDARLLERRSLADAGALIASYLTPMRLSGMASFGDSLLTGDKFGDVLLADWEQMRLYSDVALNDTLRHYATNPRDSVYLETHQWLRDVFPQETAVALAAREAALLAQGSTAAAAEATAESCSAAEGLNKFDSGKELGLMLAEFTECMGSSLMGHMASITVLKVCEMDGVPMCVSCDRDEKIRVSRLPDLWNIEAILCGHREFVTDATTCDGGLLLSCSGDHTCRLWETHSQTELACLKLDAMPFKFVPVHGERNQFTILLADSQRVIRVAVDVAAKTLQQIGTSDLPHKPLAVAGSLVLDTEGRLSVIDGSVIASFDSKPRFIRWWKHNRDQEQADRVKRKRPLSGENVSAEVAN